MGTNTVPIMGVVVPVATIVGSPPTPKKRRVVRLPRTDSKTLHRMLDSKSKKRKKTQCSILAK